MRGLAAGSVVYSVFLTAAGVLWAGMLLAGLCVGEAEGASGPVLKVRAQGFAPGSGLSARQRAITLGEQDALTLSLRELLGPRHWQLGQSLLQDSGKYIQSSRMLNIEQVDGGTRVSVEVYLDNRKLRGDVASLVFPRLGEPPRVLILIAEEIAGERFLSVSQVGVAERTLAESFEGSGFRVVPPGDLRTLYTQPELLARLQGNPELGAKLGRENRADVVVLGEAYTEVDNQGQQGNIGRIKSLLNLRILRSADGEILDVLRGEAGVRALSPGEAARMAIRDAAHKLQREAMVAAVLAMVGSAPSQIITLTIHQPGSRALVEAVEGVLRDEPGIGNLEVLRSTPEIIVARFAFNGRMHLLAERMLSLERDGHGIEAEMVAGDVMVLRGRGR